MVSFICLFIYYSIFLSEGDGLNVFVVMFWFHLQYSLAAFGYNMVSLGCHTCYLLSRPIAVLLLAHWQKHWSAQHNFVWQANIRSQVRQIYPWANGGQTNGPALKPVVCILIKKGFVWSRVGTTLAIRSVFLAIEPTLACWREFWWAC